MKKTVLIAFLLWMSLSFVLCGVAEAPSLPDMTVEELVDLQNRIVWELESRQNDGSGVLLRFETEQYCVSVTEILLVDDKTFDDDYGRGWIEKRESGYNALVYYVFENKLPAVDGEENYFYVSTGSVTDASVNGWTSTASQSSGRILPGCKGKGYLYFRVEDDEVTDLDSIRSFSFKWHFDLQVKSGYMEVLSQRITMAKTQSGWTCTNSELPLEAFGTR